MTEPRKRKQPKKPQPKYPDLIEGLTRLGLPYDPDHFDPQHPTYHSVLMDLTAETK